MPPKRKLPLSTWNRDKKKLKKIQARANKLLLTRPLTTERKWFGVGYAPKDCFAGSSYVINPFYWLAQGTQQDQRIGLTIEDVNIYVDINFAMVGSTNTSNNRTLNTSYRLFAIANPTQWHQGVVNVIEPNTAGIGTVIPAGNVYLDSGLDRTTHSFLNKDYNKVLHDSGQRLINQPWRTDYNDTPNGYVAKYRCKIKLGDLRFQANGNQSYLRDDNFYLWFTSTYFGQNGPSASDFAGILSMNILVTYKDS